MNPTPRKIIVVRHAEKPLREGTQRLSPIGVQRAEYLRQYIPENFGTPDLIIATCPTSHSVRPLQTIMPLYEAVENATLDLSVQDDDAGQLGRHLVTAAHLDGKNIVVCWHHGRIPELLKSIGLAHHEYPDPWPDDDFGSVLVVTFDNQKPVISKYLMSF